MAPSHTNPLLAGVAKRRWTLADGTTRESATYHYRRRIGGVSYSGDTGATTLRDAAAYMRDVVLPLTSATTAQTLHRAREQVVAQTEGAIPLAAAWDLFARIPRGIDPAPATVAANRSRWDDFLAYMSDTHPEASHLSDVTDEHAAAYIQYLRGHGTWRPYTTFTRVCGRKRITQRMPRTETQLSTSTLTAYRQTCQMVFRWLVKTRRASRNPFENIPPFTKRDTQSRRVFSPEQLHDLLGRAPHPLRDLILTGACTGLTKGDICLLRWVDISLDERMLDTRRAKTGTPLRIPLLPALHARLSELPHTDTYVFPDLAALYRDSPPKISYKFKQLLASAGITDTAIPVEGRSRRVSVLDIHSLRHTCAYLLGLHGTPLTVAQQILGHMTPKMTELYMRHQSDGERRDALARLPDFAGPLPESPPPDPLDALLTDLTPAQKQALLQRLTADS